MSDEVNGNVPVSEERGELAQDPDEVGQLQRLDHIAEVLDMVYLDAQGETGGTSDAAAVYEVDSTQWQALIDRLDAMQSVMSMTLFMSLLLVCGVGALLGGALWRDFSEGFRR